MSILARQSRAPRSLSTSNGEQAAQSFPKELSGLVSAAASASPFLARILPQEAHWLIEAAQDPEAHLSDIADHLKDAGDLADALRLWKRRVSGLVALADLSGAWDLPQVTGALTDFADHSVAAALGSTVHAAQSQGRVPDHVGLTAIAMGKMGAAELNYSSDIDLVLLFDDARHEDPAEVRRQLVRSARAAMKMLSEVTAAGYVFRTDLRLRPDPSVTPIVQGVGPAERYYESVGRTWERAAYIKARAIETPGFEAHEPDVGVRFLDTLTPFVWRRHLDFAAIQDVHDMRMRIRDHKRLYQEDLHGFDLKLGAGGIRDIEFYAQNHQLIHGGRDTRLRVRGTVDALQRLAVHGYIPSEAAEVLSAIYARHRRRENTLQTIRDAQTHSLPAAPQDWAAFAALLDQDLADLQSEIATDLDATRSYCEPFFAPKETRHVAPPQFGDDVLDRWPRYPALRSPRAVEIFERLRPQILDGLAKAVNPNQALLEFDRFLGGLPAGVQLFSLFEARPELVALLVDICATAPALAAYLGRNATVLDAVIDGAFFEPLSSADDYAQALRAALSAQATDYEAVLNEARRWTREQHFRIGVHFLRELVTAREAGAAYAALAEAVLKELWPHVVQAFSVKHGRPPGRGATLLAMGSLGAGQLHATSDLDLIVIYDAQGVEASTGPRPLATRAYYARLTQALITALTAPMPQGRLYEVDMRLRPSGRNGPVATSLQAFEAYQRDEAWTWERLALTRARSLAGDADMMSDVEAIRTTELSRRRETSEVLKDLADMRARLREARPAAEGLTIKDGAGGLQDIELFAQALGLVSRPVSRDTSEQIDMAVAADLILDRDASVLKAAVNLMWGARATVKLISPEAKDFQALGDGGQALLSRTGGQATPEDLTETLARAHEQAAAIIEATLERLT